MPVLRCKRACFVAQNRLFWCVKQWVLQSIGNHTVTHLWYFE